MEHPNSNQIPKTLGPQTGRLVLSLYDRNQPIFGLAAAQEILGTDRNTTQQLVFELVKRGIATRLKPGLFRLVPFELGFEREYLGNPYVVARELVGSRRDRTASKTAQTRKTDDYYLSHGSALDLHQIVTQPQLVVYATTPRMIRPKTILGTEFRFVRCKPADLFGITDVWADKNEKVRVSDLERTILDGLKQPNYCGGLTEVAKALWIKRSVIDPGKLVDYASRLKIGAVLRRIGFLMELYEFKSQPEIERLRSKLTATYHLLDPELPSEGKFIARWRLRLNVTEEELRDIVRT
ncbi:MAG: transcriptional regulator [Deltaproteobacteria bacterium]|nr:transcriptional regulator [Deltaproteobacteria bacterium]